MRVRVVNASDLGREKFRLNPVGQNGKRPRHRQAIYLPPGQMRVFEAPKIPDVSVTRTPVDRRRSGF